VAEKADGSNEIDVHFPLAGADRSGSSWVQPVRQRPGGVYYTTPEGVNVRASDAILERFRGGSRPGTSRVRNSEPGGPDEPLQLLMGASLDPAAYLPGHPTLLVAAYPQGGDGEGTMATYYAKAVDGVITAYDSSMVELFSDQPFLEAGTSDPWAGDIDIDFSTDGLGLYAVGGTGAGQVACYYEMPGGTRFGPIAIYDDPGFRGGMRVRADLNYAYFTANPGGGPIQVRRSRDLNTAVDVTLLGDPDSREGCCVAVYDA
jgi:hypothetical protein